MKLNDKEWKEFKINNLFIIEKCKCSSAAKLSKNGKTPYVGATNKNNGTLDFVQQNEKMLSKGNSIVFICDGQGSVGYSIYKKENFIGSTTLKIGRNKNLNKYNALFFTTALDKNKIIYDYGYKRNEKRLKNETINLPIDKNNQPDYQFMEDYIKYIYKNKLQKYINYIKKQLSKIEYKEIESLENKKFKEFFIVDIFQTIQRGKRLTKAKQIKGNIPYISSTAQNNGVDNFIGNLKNVRIFENCLTIANSGSVGSSFYHLYKFVASDHVAHLKNENFNLFIYLFIATLTNRFSQKYNFNREINDFRISREKILLPINAKNEPDYEYMEQYIKNLIHKKINKYLRYIERQKD